MFPTYNRFLHTQLHICCFNNQVMWQLDITLFSMMIQGGLSDSKGRVWRRHPDHMYAIEVTRTDKEVYVNILNTNFTHRQITYNEIYLLTKHL